MPNLNPIKVKDLPPFLKAIEPVLRSVEEGRPWSAIACAYPDALVDAVVIGAGVERPWLEEQTIEILADLAFAVLEVNIDFFVQTLLPRLQELGDRLNTATGSLGGTASAA